MQNRVREQRTQRGLSQAELAAALGVSRQTVISIESGSLGWGVALGSAAIGALAAPMIFEFPFDLIVMARIYPPIPPHPALYRVLFFAPLFLIEVLTLSLLTLSPAVRLSKAAFFFFALMLAVFAVWGLFGFGYPSAPAPFTFNVVSKILAFVVTLSLFLRREPRPGCPIGHVALPHNGGRWISGVSLARSARCSARLGAFCRRAPAWPCT